MQTLSIFLQASVSILSIAFAYNVIRLIVNVTLNK